MNEHLPSTSPSPVDDSPNPQNNPRDGSKVSIDQACVNLLYRQTPIGIVGSLICALALIYLLRFLVATKFLVAWLVGMVLIAAVRSILAERYSRNPVPDAEIYRWRRWNVITLGISGALWGSSALLFFTPESVPHQLFLAILLFFMVAGAGMAFFTVRSAFFAFSIPALLPLIVRLLTIHSELHLVLVVLAVLLWVLSLIIANNIYRAQMKILQLKENLNTRVIERTEALQRVNDRLQAQNQEYVRIEENLRQERDRLETITGNIGAGLVVISREYKILWVNKVLKDLVGNAEGQACFRSFNCRENICEECVAKEVFEQNKEKAICEQKGYDAQGEVVWFQIIATPIRDRYGNVRAALELVLPITELKKSREQSEQIRAQLEEARKWEAIATLAGGMAHEFNNALSVIVGNVELLELDHPQEFNLERYIAPIAQSAQKMSRLTHQLLVYAKGGLYKPQTIDLSAFIDRTLPLMNGSLAPNIRLTTALEKQLPPVRIDPTQMQTVISAVIMNACEAVDKKGNIEVSCYVSQLREKEVSHDGIIQAGLWVVMRVADDGAGMDHETLQRIFEPFFTTKFQGRGLGMAAVYGIVKNHGGHVRVKSEPDRGTQVSILLPPATALASSATESPELPPASSEKPTILLIEDEALVRQVNREILKRLGYQVIEARTGQEAIDLIRHSTQAFDMVFLDIKLPDMEGTAIYPIIRKHRGAVKVIVCSGYALDGPTQSLLDAGADGFIPKPFSFSAVSEKVKEVMARDKEAP